MGARTSLLVLLLSCVCANPVLAWQQTRTLQPQPMADNLAPTWGDRPATVRVGPESIVAGEAVGGPNVGYVVKIVDPNDGMPVDDGAECGACCMNRVHPAPWEHSVSLFGDFLYMRPRNAEVAYGVPVDGPIVGPPPASPIQIGRTGMVDADFTPAFRVGGSVDLNHPANIRAMWTHFDTNDSDSISITAPNVIRSLVSHPNSQSAATSFLTGSGTQDIGFDLVDLDYRAPLMCGRLYYVNYLLGARYANLDQQFSSTFANLGQENVRTDVGFNGAGIRLGIEGERYAPRSGFKLYSRGSASFVAGSFQAAYTQTQTFDPQVVHTDMTAGRIVPMIDFELGGGWASQNGRFHVTAGYLVTAWFNTVKTSEFIQGVRSNNLANLSDTLTFDGFVARAELRY